MISEFTTEGIYALRAERRRTPPGWIVTFRSDHAGDAHQLYVNGRLVDWTDTPRQRSFALDDYGACELIVAAVPGPKRATDFSRLLPADSRKPAWVFEAAVPRLTGLSRCDRIEVLGDGATGQLDPTPLATAQAWPESVARWACGEDRFGQGGFGYDGSQAPGAGMGAFGAGEFGMDAGAIVLRPVLSAPGEHALVIRSVSPAGGVAELPPQSFVASPPPASPSNVAVTDYDSQNQTVTLQIERG